MNITDLPQVRTGPERRHKRKRGARVRPDALGKPFNVNIRVEGKTYNLGYAATKEEAHAMFREAFRWVYGEDPWRDDSPPRSRAKAKANKKGPV